MVLVKNWPYFFSFYFLPYRPRQCVSNIYERKKVFPDYKKRSSKNRKIQVFFKGVRPWSWSKIGHFNIFSLRTSRPGKCVLRYSRTKKKAFIGYKNKKFQKVEKLRFLQKGQSMVLVKNWPFSHFLILVLLGRENVFCDILEPKNAFLSYKKQEVQKF